MTHSLASRLMIVAALLVLITAPAGAAGIEAGSDLWRTPGDGSTYADFAQDPIPAGFFCPGSEPFSGRIEFRGEPLATSPAGVLRETDTIVERLDTAVFDADGVARTRIRVAALSFEALEPLVTSCGVFDVTTSLAGPQPVTEMVIQREGKAGGSFVAPISVVVRMVFMPRKGLGSLEVVRRLDFAASPDAHWTVPEVSRGLIRQGPVQVDTDGDLRADTYVPGTTNFAAGWELDPSTGETGTNNLMHCGNPPDCTHEHSTIPLVSY